jgi:hypothetical protein
MYNVSQVICHTGEWHILFATPFRRDKGQVSLGIGQLRESTEYGCDLLDRKHLKKLRHADKAGRFKAFNASSVLLNLVFC